uniref:Uncharacterized protein n=1 Tax=Picea glauca TaxID=3330 RepID=A0A101LXZ6_PICGL|nr:hypothetical protein ABT39_MTgene5612 [Picea glauca]
MPVHTPTDAQVAVHQLSLTLLFSILQIISFNPKRGPQTQRVKVVIKRIQMARHFGSSHKP